MARLFAAILCLIAIALVASPAWTLDVAPSELEQKLEIFDPAAVEAARSYARAADMKALIESTIPSLRQLMTSQVKAKNPSVNDAQVNAFVEAFLKVAYVDQAAIVEQATILLMREVFSTDEIIALNEFYSSPIGRKLLAKMPRFAARTTELTILMQSYVFPQAVEAAQQTMKKNGVDIQL
jgi:hypothetical protein